MNGASVRIQLDLSSCVDEHPKRWMLVDIGVTKSIRALCSELEGKFSKQNFLLYINGCWLPSEESTSILHNGDVVTVVQAPKNSVRQVSTSSDSESSCNEPIKISKKEQFQPPSIVKSVAEKTECDEPPRKKRKRRRKRKQKNKNKLPEDEIPLNENTLREDSSQPSVPLTVKLSNTEGGSARHKKFQDEDDDQATHQNEGESKEEAEPTLDPGFKTPDKKFGAQMMGVSCEEVLLNMGNRKSRKSLETCDASVESRNLPVNTSSNECSYKGLKSLISMAKLRQPVRGERRSLDVKSCPDLNTSSLKEGDKVAFKVFELSENYEPGMSEYKSGIVTGFEGECVTIQLDEDSRKERNGKFEMDTGDDSGILTINITDMQCAKLISQK